MATLVCTLQAAPILWDSLAQEVQHELLRWTTVRDLTPEALAQAERSVAEQLAYSPLTATIAVLGLFDVERNVSVTYYVDTATEAGFDTRVKPRSEAGLLRDFWEGAPAYDTFVSFNGRRYLLPFLLHRSAVHAVIPSVMIPFERTLERQGVVSHVDLLDQLTFQGLTRRHTLYHYCHAYGLTLPTPVAATAALVAERRMEEAAVAVQQTLTATAELYAYWRQFFGSEHTVQY